MIPAVYLGPGIAVWLFAKASSFHVGASGLVYGLVSYIFVAGVIRRDRRAIAASLLVSFLYGSLVWGVFPIQRRGFLGNPSGGRADRRIVAIVLRRLDIPPRVRYSWEDEEGGPGDPGEQEGYEDPRPGNSDTVQRF